MSNDNLADDEQARVNIFNQILQTRGINTENAAMMANSDGTYTLRKTFSPSAEHQALSEHFDVDLKAASIKQNYVETHIQADDAPQIAALN